MSKKSWLNLIPVIEKVQAAVNIEDLLKEQGRILVRKGDRLYTECPFHQEKSPSFSLEPLSQLFFCHGCKQGGRGVIGFVRIRDRTSFYSALESLCAKHDINLHPERPSILRKTVVYQTSESDKSPGEAGSGERAGFAIFVRHPTEFKSASVCDVKDIHEPQDGCRTYLLEFEGIGTLSLTRRSFEKLVEDGEAVLKKFPVKSPPW